VTVRHTTWTGTQRPLRPESLQLSTCRSAMSKMRAYNQFGAGGSDVDPHPERTALVMRVAEAQQGPGTDLHHSGSLPSSCGARLRRNRQGELKVRDLWQFADVGRVGYQDHPLTEHKERLWDMIERSCVALGQGNEVGASHRHGAHLTPAWEKKISSCIVVREVENGEGKRH
jgi:hypothetical protein